MKGTVQWRGLLPALVAGGVVAAVVVTLSLSRDGDAVRVVAGSESATSDATSDGPDSASEADVPEVPIDMNVTSTLDCGPSNNTNGLANYGIDNIDPAPGGGFPTPQAAVDHFTSFYPTAPSFRLTGRTRGLARFENGQTVFLVTLIPDVGWFIEKRAICDDSYRQWQADAGVD